VAQGLSADQVVALLESASGEGLPPNLVSAIRGVRPVSRRTGTQPAPALDLDNETVRLLKASRATARLLAPAPRDHLYLRPGVSWEAFRAAAARAGLLLETSVAE
jgi:hypothetical protein